MDIHLHTPHLFAKRYGINSIQFLNHPAILIVHTVFEGSKIRSDGIVNVMYCYSTIYRKFLATNTTYFLLLGNISQITVSAIVVHSTCVFIKVIFSRSPYVNIHQKKEI